MSALEHDRCGSGPQFQFSEPWLCFRLLSRYPSHTGRLRLIESNFANDRLSVAHVDECNCTEALVAPEHRIGVMHLAIARYLCSNRVAKLRVPEPFPGSAPQIVHRAPIFERFRHLVKFSMKLNWLVTDR